MRTRNLLLISLLMLIGVSMAKAQSAYTYVQQNSTKIDKLGTAAFDLTKTPTVEFVDGKAVMTVGSNTVATLPMSDNGQLAVEFDGTTSNVSKTYSNAYATLYSPFQLTVPADVEVYAPTYDSDNHVLNCNSTTIIAEGEVIPVGTALLLKNAGTYEFVISADASTATPSSVLSGSSLLIDVPTVESGNTLYTLGHEKDDNTKFGFFKYNGATLGAGLAYLVKPTFDEGVSENSKYITLSFDDETTGINLTPAISQGKSVRKYIENDRVVIARNGQKFNLNGQEIK